VGKLELSPQFKLLYEQIQQMRTETTQRLDRLDQKLDSYAARISKLEQRQALLQGQVELFNNSLEGFKEYLAEHSERISQIERHQANLDGKVTAWSGFVSAVVSFISRLLPWGGGQQ